uniref:Uncharacterized protein n=1 Tax=Talaromyces marneffei PM1 TaxID=1077442 RepID=A0A093V311_TALMA
MNQIFKSIPILCLFSLVGAQYGNPGGSGANTVTTSSLLPSSTTATSSAVQTVTVGRGGLIFSPDTLTVSPGGKVEFQFVSGDHSVTQSTFADPCHPVNETSLSSGIISAGGGPVDIARPVWLESLILLPPVRILLMHTRPQQKMQTPVLIRPLSMAVFSE